ncbi:MAG: tripartite tricarboxylate transporter substrate binding protein, partial [Alcaligenaceae bacterium]
LGLLSSTAHAQAYPNKPIKLIIPFNAGGALDIVGRLLASELSKQFNQTVVVENKAGAGGNIAASFVAKSDPDGYTLLMGSTGNSVNKSLYGNLNYDPDKDLTPVGIVGQMPNVLLAHKSVPVKNINELIALSKSNPTSLNFASGGSGTSEHLAAALFNLQAGTTIPHIPYRGGAPATADLMSGQVQLMFTNQITAISAMQSGNVKVLGNASASRSPSLPDTLTFIEQGMKGFLVAVWWGVFGPGNLSPELVDRLNQAINASVKMPEMTAKLDSMGATPMTMSAAEFKAFFGQESARWAETVKSAKIKVE